MLNIILITHEGIGSSMLAVAENIVGKIQKSTACYEIAMDAETDAIMQDIAANIESTNLDTLIITDLVGSTPYNIALSLSEKYNTGLVSGLNLPMLLRIFNYRAYRLEDVTDKAVEGGRLSIQSR